MVVKGCGAGFGLPLICNPLAKHITFTTPVRVHTSLHPSVPGCGLMPRLAKRSNHEGALQSVGHSTATPRP